MRNNESMSTGHLSYFYQFLFALNIVLVAILEGNQRPNRLFSVLEYGEAGLGTRVNAFLHLHPHSNVGANGAFFVYALVWATCLFLLLRITSGTHLAQRFLRSLGGIVSLLALPLSWLYVSHLLGWDSFLPGLPRGLLFLELLAAIVCAVMYLRATWSLPIWGSVALLTLHFAFWDTVCFGPYFWRAPFQSIFAIAGFFSALLWARTVPVQTGRATQT